MRIAFLTIFAKAKVSAFSPLLLAAVFMASSCSPTFKNAERLVRSVTLGDLSLSSLSATNTTVGLTGSFSVSIQNNTSQAIDLNSVIFTNTGTTTGTEFSITGGSCTFPGTLAATGSCTISGTFTPVAASSRVEQLTITYQNGANIKSETPNLSGLGLTPASLQLSAVTFSNTNLGGSSTAVTTTVSNVGQTAATLNTRTLNSTGTTTGADYSISGGTCSDSSTIAAGGSCTIQLTFIPTLSGNRTDTLDLDYSDGVNPQTQNLALSATGVQLSLASVTVTNSSPTTSTTYNLTYGAVTGVYTDYCILENDTTLANCTSGSAWVTGTLPSTYAVTTSQNAKILSVWIRNGGVSARVDSNAVTLDTTAPSAPSGLTLISPGSSPGTDDTPTIRIAGLSIGDTVNLFTNSSCTVPSLRATGVSSGATLDLTSSSLTLGASVSFYANASDPVGNTSTCSVATVAYQYVSTPTLSFTGATGTTGNVGVAMSVSPTSLSAGSGATISSCAIKASTTALPTGLSVDNSTCVISGTPSVSAGNTTYTLTLTNSFSQTVDTTVDLTVVAATPPPSAPTGVTAAAGTANILVNWSAVAGASTYTVYRSTTSGSGFSALAACTAQAGVSCSDLTALNGTTYYYVVQATNAGGTSGNSSEVSGRPISSFTISSVAVNNSGGPLALVVTWGSATGAASYDVTWGTGGASSGVGSATGVTSPYTVSSLTAGTAYTFLVTATNAVGSGNSVNASASVSGTPMTRPTFTSVTHPALNQADVAWNGGSGSTAFTLKYGNTSGTYGSTYSTSATSPANLTGLGGGVDYYFMVSATNASGSLDAAAEGGPLAVTGVLGAPTGFTAVVGTSVALSWDSVAGASTYTVYRSTTAGSGYSALAACTAQVGITCNDLTAAAGVIYYYVVRATNGGGTSGNSSEISGSPISSPTLTNVAVTEAGGPNALVLTWSNPGATSFDVTWGTGGASTGAGSAAGVTSPYTVSGLTAGTAYTFVVFAKNSIGVGASTPSNSRTGTPMIRPVMTGITQTGTETIEVSFIDSPGATSYGISSFTSSGTQSNRGTTTTSPGVGINITHGILQYVAVYAQNPNGNLRSTTESTFTLYPYGLTYSGGGSYTYTVGTDITPATVTAIVTGGPAVTYSISPAFNPNLPPGLSLNPTTGSITGIPLVAQSAATYTITATNSLGSTTKDITIAISPDVSGALTLSRNFKDTTGGTQVRVSGVTETPSIGLSHSGGTQLLCKTAKIADFNSTSFALCQSGVSLPSTYEPDLSAGDGTYITEVRLMNGATRVTSAGYQYYVHSSLEDLDSCEYNETDSWFFNEAGTYLEQSEQFLPSTKTQAPFSVFELPAIGGIAYYKLFGGIYQNNGRISRTQQKFNIMTLKKKFIMHSSKSMVLLKREYPSTVGNKGSCQMRITNAGNPASLGGDYPGRNGYSTAHSNSCDAVVVNAINKGVCFESDGGGSYVINKFFRNVFSQMRSGGGAPWATYGGPSDYQAKSKMFSPKKRTADSPSFVPDIPYIDLED